MDVITGCFFVLLWFKFSFVTVIEIRLSLRYNWINSCFRIQTQENGEYIPSPESLCHVEAVLQLLSIMTDDTRFEDVLNQKDFIQEGGIHNMNEWLDRVEAASRAEGMAKGEIIGAIKLYRDEMHLMPVEITGKIMERFCLEREEAEKYIAEVLGLQPA